MAGIIKILIRTMKLRLFAAVAIAAIASQADAVRLNYDEVNTAITDLTNKMKNLTDGLNKLQQVQG